MKCSCDGGWIRRIKTVPAIVYGHEVETTVVRMCPKCNGKGNIAERLDGKMLSAGDK